MTVIVTQRPILQVPSTENVQFFSTIENSVSSPGSIECSGGPLDATLFQVGQAVYFTWPGAEYKSQHTTVLIIDGPNGITLDIPYTVDATNTNAGQLTTSGLFIWNYAYNPVIYKLQREDFGAPEILTSVQDAGGGNIRCNVVGTASDYVTVGDVLYLKVTGSTLVVIYDGLVEVQAVGGSNFTVVGIAYTQDVNPVGENSYFNNLSVRNNYRLDVFFLDAENDSRYFPDGVEYTPAQDGSLTLDASSLMSSFLDAKYFEGATQEDLSLRFYIQVYEAFNDESSLQVDDIANPVGLVLGAKQLLDKYGANLVEYTPDVHVHETLGVQLVNQGKFLTRFKEPSLWLGWPNFISGLANGELITGAGRFIVEKPLDINKQPLTGGNAISILGDDNVIFKVELLEFLIAGLEKYRAISFTTGVSLLDTINYFNALDNTIDSLYDCGEYIRLNGFPSFVAPYSLIEVSAFIGNPF